MNKTAMKSLFNSIGMRVDQPWEYSPGDMGGGLFAPILRETQTSTIIAQLDSPSIATEPLAIVLRQGIDPALCTALIMLLPRLGLAAEWRLVLRDHEGSLLAQTETPTHV